ncbi:MAG: FG-GAP repeat protein [Thermoanaerobaculia bacterium]
MHLVGGQMHSGTKRVSKQYRLLAAVLLSILSVIPRSWAQGLESTLLPLPDPSTIGFFGASVSLSEDGQRAIAGAPTFSPKAYIFVRSGGGWVLEARLTDGSVFGSFGSAVALSADGTVALVTDLDEICSNSPYSCGAVYVYVRTDGVWTQKAHLARPLLRDFEFDFGRALALSADGSTVLVGRPADDCIQQLCRGVVFVYERTGDSWDLVDMLRASNPSVQKLGSAISLSPDGSTALIGAPRFSCVTGSICGEAYVFTRSGGSWSEQARLTAFDAASEGFFGSSVGLSADGQTALIGSPSNDFDPQGPGSVYAFVRSGNAWIGTQKITGGSGEGFGRSLGLAAGGRSALLGAPFTDCAAGADCGAVYRIVRGPSGLWSSPQPLASFPAGAQGGSAVALSGDGSVGLAGAQGTFCPTGGPLSCGAVHVFSGLLATLDIPTLGGPGLAVLTIALILSALILLQRRRSI